MLGLVSLSHDGGHGRQGTGESAILKRHWWLLATTAIFAAGAANAQSPAPDLDKVDRMQRQMEQLQEQMKEVKSDLVEAKKKAAEAKAEIPAAFNGAYGADKPFPAKAPSIVDRVKLTWGGFLAAETVYRTHNIVSDEGDSFNNIPYRRFKSEVQQCSIDGMAE
jgi:hypothetical protein